MEWTAEKVAALAPNASTERRGKTLAQASKWTSLGTNGAAIWENAEELVRSHTYLK